MESGIFRCSLLGFIRTMQSQRPSGSGVDAFGRQNADPAETAILFHVVSMSLGPKPRARSPVHSTADENAFYLGPQGQVNTLVHRKLLNRWPANHNQRFGQPKGERPAPLGRGLPPRFGHVDDDAIWSAELYLSVAARLAVAEQSARSRHHRGGQLLAAGLVDLLGK